MQVEKQTFNLFERLLILLQIPRSEHFLHFDKGKLLRYETPRDFEYSCSNFYEEVLTNISNIRNKQRLANAAEAFHLLVDNLRVLLKRIFKGHL